MYSLTGTQETVETLERQTGPVDLVLYGPRRLGEVLQWPGMVGAAGGIVLGFAFLRRRSALGIAAAVLALRRLRAPRLRRPGDHPPLHDARRRDAGDLRRRSACSAGGCSSPATLAPRAGSSSPARRADVPGLAAEPVDLDSRVDTDLTNQARIEWDLTTSSTPAPSSRSACRSGPQPPRGPPPRLRPRCAADRIVSAIEQRQPTRGYFLDPAAVRDPQLHPRPQRPDPTSIQSPGFARVPRTVLERLPSLLSCDDP